MRKRTQAREIVLTILYQWDVSGDPPEELLETYWKYSNVNDSDIKVFTERIVLGTIQNKDAIDKIVSKYTDNWELSRMAFLDRNILRFSTFELLYMPDVPPKVTINESINIAKKFSQDESGKFVNGVLDKINHAEKKIDPQEVDN